ncbi:MAG: glucose 1-dehydrogenase [Aggregatilineales bacterium]|nr:glucose 1-dehydrogenase [Chloroflexota bacterium]HPT61255.1 glucose 1-dehydrogenase [Bacillota bacterium]
MKLEGYRTLVTGGASGIGRAISLAFAKEGAKVCLVDVQDEAGENVEQEIRQMGREAVYVRADVSRAEEVDTAVDHIEELWGGIDVLVNNAALAIPGTVDTLTEAEWDLQLNVNLKGFYLFSRRIVPIMRRQGGGSIINMGSVTSLVGVRGYAAYVASKAAIAGLTRAMALDHASEGIRVNCICPSGIKTPLMEQQFMAAEDPERERQRVIDLHPIRRMAEPWEVAEFAVYLASEAAAFLTGAVLPFEGGYTSQ